MIKVSGTTNSPERLDRLVKAANGRYVNRPLVLFGEKVLYTVSFDDNPSYDKFMTCLDSKPVVETIELGWRQRFREWRQGLRRRFNPFPGY
jgi:hypothetical protein